ncbi:MAG: polyprenol monophosphomannose synthase [Candidatus Eremiobacteraeota bacterium]|nr:polyprenol monophosphomannose synthase [Candidatus Eremiobacteraeota bacterium]MBC5827327.1 polyprenol monophosphomannose synthase [Candidatus Eremiobacteraeota bacterium]
MPLPADVSVVIPTYNEAAGIEKLIAAVSGVFRSAGLSAEIVIVDDNSPDGTGAIVERLAASYPVRCLHRAGKLGLSSAVIDGWASCAAAIVGVMDADFSHDPNIAPSLVGAIKNGDCDLAIGSRYVDGGGITNWPLRRRLTSLVAIALARPLTRVKDITSGYFFCKRSVIEGVKLDPIGFKIGLEVIVKGKYKNVQEVPYVFTDRTHGASKLNGGEIVNYLKQLGKMYAGGRRQRGNGFGADA